MNIITYVSPLKSVDNLLGVGAGWRINYGNRNDWHSLSRLGYFGRNCPIDEMYSDSARIPHMSSWLLTGDWLFYGLSKSVKTWSYFQFSFQMISWAGLPSSVN